MEASWHFSCFDNRTNFYPYDIHFELGSLGKERKWYPKTTEVLVIRQTAVTISEKLLYWSFMSIHNNRRGIRRWKRFVFEIWYSWQRNADLRCWINTGCEVDTATEDERTPVDIIGVEETKLLCSTLLHTIMHAGWRCGTDVTVVELSSSNMLVLEHRWTSPLCSFNLRCSQ